MKVLVGTEDARADKVHPSVKADASGIGINYADAYLKAFRGKLEDGRRTACKRRGLKLTLTVGEKKGEGLMRRLEHGPDIKTILLAAIEEAAQSFGASLSVEDGNIYLDLPDTDAI